jgi:hypothetical protein
MTSGKRRFLTGISLVAAVATFSLAVTPNTGAAMPMAAGSVHAAQAGLSQVEKTQVVVGGPRWRGPAWRRGRRCFWRRGRRVCVWR